MTPQLTASFKLITTAILAFALCACSTAPLKPSDIKAGDTDSVVRYLQWLVTKELEDKHLPSISVALVNDQSIVWQTSVGYADREQHIAADGDTLYRVGSITKVFTAMAALQLAEQGKIDLDQPLSHYLPDFTLRRREDIGADAEQVTPRNILTHHSGLVSDLVKSAWSMNPLDEKDLLEQLQYEYPASKANLIHAYSNLGFTLLGYAIAHVTQQPYPQYLYDNFLKPMAMQRSVLTPMAPMNDNRAVPYHHGKREKIYGTSNLAAGGLWSSSNDMSRFLIALFANDANEKTKLLSNQSMQQWFSPQNRGVKLDFDMETGFAWFLQQTSQDNMRVAEHGGGTIGFRSKVKLIPQQKLGVIVLCNADNGGDSVNKIAGIALNLLYRAKTGNTLTRKKYNPLASKNSNVLPFELTGHYASGAGLITINKDGSDYTIDAFGRHFVLKEKANGLFKLQYRLWGFIPWPSSQVDKLVIKPERVDQRQLLTLIQHGRQTLIAEKIAPYQIPSSWREWLGALKITNPDDIGVIKNVSLSERDGWLLARFQSDLGIPSNIDILLKPLNDHLAVIAGLGRGQGSSIEIVNHDGRAHLRFSGYLLEKASRD